MTLRKVKELELLRLCNWRLLFVVRRGGGGDSLLFLASFHPTSFDLSRCGAVLETLGRGTLTRPFFSTSLDLSTPEVLRLANSF